MGLLSLSFVCPTFSAMFGNEIGLFFVWRQPDAAGVFWSEFARRVATKNYYFPWVCGRQAKLCCAPSEASRWSKR